MKQAPFKKSDIAQSFSLAAKQYDQHAFVQKEVGNRLLARLDLLRTPPQTILDVGAGTGFITRKLQQKFPQSRVYGLDLAQGMSHFAKKNQSWHLLKKQPQYICGDMEFLPFQSQSFDFIFSNFTLQWGFDLNPIFAEFKRILKPNGLIFFSTLGPNTLIELRQSFATVSSSSHVNAFVDMHDIGDILLNTRFSDPVVDMEMITVTYKDVREILQDLKATGARNFNTKRMRGCTPKGYLQKMMAAYEAFKQPDGFYPATFEVIYGHAWHQERFVYGQDDDDVVRIPGDKIPILQTI
jgi:malonyl-CoA O-methyltransferase